MSDTPNTGPVSVGPPQHDEVRFTIELNGKRYGATFEDVTKFTPELIGRMTAATIREALGSDRSMTYPTITLTRARDILLDHCIDQGYNTKELVEDILGHGWISDKFFAEEVAQ